MIYMSILSKASQLRGILYAFISGLTYDDIKEFIDRFDEDLLPPFLLSLLLICIVIAMILIISDTHIIDDIVYPYLVLRVITH